MVHRNRLNLQAEGPHLIQRRLFFIIVSVISMDIVTLFKMEQEKYIVSCTVPLNG
jgi:hypothetical protein